MSVGGGCGATLGDSALTNSLVIGPDDKLAGASSIDAWNPSNVGTNVLGNSASDKHVNANSE
jgi:hypothetical protein